MHRNYWEEQDDPKSHAAAVFRLYDSYRAYVVHEDVLINERLQRMLIIQGFLFAAQGTVLPKFCEGLWNPTYETGVLGLFGLSIAGCGALAAYLIRDALKAACNALSYLEKEWNAIGRREANRLGIPGLRGGGDPKADKLGRNHILWLPSVFFWIWIVFIFVIGLGGFVAFQAYRSGYHRDPLHSSLLVPLRSSPHTSRSRRADADPSKLSR